MTFVPNSYNSTRIAQTKNLENKQKEKKVNSTRSTCDLVRDLIRSSMTVTTKMLGNPSSIETIKSAAEAMVSCYRNGGRVFICGNGGSAADSNHFAAELTGRFMRERKPLAAESLAANTSVITALTNDYGPEHVFARQLEANAKPGDVLVAISTSGCSPNIIKAIEAARLKNVVTIGLTGNGEGCMNDCDHLIRIPSTKTPRIQEGHLLVEHILCQLVEDSLFPPTEASLFPPEGRMV